MAEVTVNEASAAVLMEQAGYRFWRCTPLNKAAAPYWSAMPMKGSVMHHFDSLDKIEGFIRRVEAGEVYTEVHRAQVSQFL